MSEKMKGIYQIRNKLNNKKYYGSSIDINKRWREHKSELENNKKENPHLQNAWNKYGADSFIFEIILLCEKFELEYYEQWFLDNVVKWGIDYNIGRCVDAPMRGRSHTKETKRKIGEANSGKIQTIEHKRKISKAHIGKKLSNETKKKMSKSKSGENSSNHKLTNKDVIKIRELYSSKQYTQTELGSMFNILPSSISRIINYKRWKYI